MGTLFEDTVVVPVPPTAYTRGFSGSIVELKDGSLLFACGDFRGEINKLGIIGRISTDKGRTWDKPFSMQKNIARLVTISPSLLRLKNGDLLFGYCVANNYTGPDIRQYDGQYYMRRSSDDGKTWSDQFCVTRYPSYHTVNPDRVIQLSSGRIIVPTECTKEVGGGEAGHMVSLCYYTDDGYTWIRSKNFVDAGSTTEEPSIVELKDGRLLMVFRSLKGYVGRAYSSDQGETWTEPDFYDLPSPLAPQYITRIPKTGDLLLLWLNNPYAPGWAKGKKQAVVKIAEITRPRGQVRAPLSSAVSRDEGLSWEHVRNIKSDAEGDYGYPDYGYQSVAFVDDVALINYNALDGIHVTRIGTDWFYEE